MNKKNTTFAYGFDNQRRKMEYIDASGNTKTTYYIGDYEYSENNGVIKEVHYINGVSGLDALYVINNDDDADNGSIYYTAKDHLGSITAIFDENNSVVNENSYDAWGRKRDPNNWEYDLSYKQNMPMADITDRGYTGHEHLDGFQLINMNGRLYDPITKQMSQPDIHNPDPYATQSYNRYAYVMNNPLKWVDPSGYHYVLGMKSIFAEREHNTLQGSNSFKLLMGLENWDENSVLEMWNTLIRERYENFQSQLSGGGNVESLALGSLWFYDLTSINVIVKIKTGRIQSISSFYSGLGFTVYEQKSNSIGKAEGNKIYFTIIGLETTTIGIGNFSFQIKNTVRFEGYVDSSSNYLYLNLFYNTYPFHPNRYYLAN